MKKVTPKLALEHENIRLRKKVLEQHRELIEYKINEELLALDEALNEKTSEIIRQHLMSGDDEDLWVYDADQRCVRKKADNESENKDEI